MGTSPIVVNLFTIYHSLVTSVFKQLEPVRRELRGLKNSSIGFVPGDGVSEVVIAVDSP